MLTKIQIGRGREVIVEIGYPCSSEMVGQVHVSFQRHMGKNGWELNLGQLLCAGFYVVEEEGNPMLAVFLTEHEAKKYASGRSETELHNPLSEQINRDLRQSLCQFTSWEIESLSYIKNLCDEPTA